jgi:hypothetical protein
MVYEWKKHRENDKPAIIYSDGTQQWWYKGERHRDNDLPAIIRPDGTQIWYMNGLVHRENDLPAVIYPNGSQEWYINGKLHRENDKPAIIYLNGYQEWWSNGERQRLCGPAVITSDKKEYWYIDDKNITEEVLLFIEEYGLTHWSEWTDKDKILFKMKF